MEQTKRMYFEGVHGPKLLRVLLVGSGLLAPAPAWADCLADDKKIDEKYPSSERVVS